MRFASTRNAALVTLYSIASVVCGSAAAQTAFDPGGPIEIVVHSGPGGGSDVHARQVSELLVKEGLIEQAWPVINKTGGSGAAAMAYMAEPA